MKEGRRSEGGKVGADFKKEGGGREDDKLPPMPELAKICVPEPPPDPNLPKAQIVVIANLPLGFKQHNIYELISGKTAKVLHVFMKNLNRPPEPEMRYAFVYFKTQEEVTYVVEYLDNMVVNGYALDVSTVDNLLLEG